MNTNNLTLQRKIMRRVYIAFARRIVAHPVTLQIATFALALVVFAKLVHVKRIVEGILNSSLDNIPMYVFHTIVGALWRGEVLTLIAVGVLVFSVLSIPRHVYRLMWSKHVVSPAVSA